MKFFLLIYGFTRLLQAKKGYPSLSDFTYPFLFGISDASTVGETTITGRNFFINFR